MATHSTTDLKPGDIVQHPEHGYGVVLKNFPGVPTIYFAGEHGYENTTRRFTGWEHAEIETIRPGHVQVRVNDLDLSRWEGVFEGGWNHSTRVAIRAANAISAQRDESAPPAQPDEPTLFGARIVVTDDLSGKAERWCRQHDEYWASENGALMTWAYLTQRGTVTLGWETLGWDE